MQVVTSGISYIDDAVGGGIVKGSSLLVMYDSLSSGWTLPFKILKEQLKRGAVGIIINYNLPLQRLILRARSAGLEVNEEGMKGNLFIVDVFGSRYNPQPSNGYVYRIGGFNPETYIPKLEGIYRDILQKTGDREIVDLIFSLDGMAFEVGEERTIKLLKRLFTNNIINGRGLFSMYLLGTDRVSKEFLSWNIEFSDYVIEFSGRKYEHGVIEEMYVLRSPLPNFEPRAYRYNGGGKEPVPIVTPTPAKGL